MNLRTLTSAPARALRARSVGAHRPPVAGRRPAVYLAVAAAGAVLFNVIAGTEPAADAAQLDSASVAEQLGVSAQAEPLAAGDVVAPLEQLAASRSERDAERTAAAATQAAADQAEQVRLAAEAAAAQAAAQAAAEEAARAAEAEAAQAAVAPGGSYQDYAVGQLGGNGGEFGCLENLWGKESGWNPNAQNPSSTAYGIPQFLDSTWAGTGIAKTSDGYRQIDAGLIYINDRYGSPCGAWSHSTSTGWY
jgi:Transglycosylase SLT domain